MIEPTGKETVDFDGTTSEKIFLDKVEQMEEVEQEVNQKEPEIPEISPVTSSTQVPGDIPLKKSAKSIKSESLPAAKSVLSVTSQASQAKATTSAISVKTAKSALSAKSTRSTKSAVSAKLAMSAKSVVSTKSTARATSPVKSAAETAQVVLPGTSVGGGIKKVTACGAGLERGIVNIPSDFSISTREAGAGSLSIAVKGPAKARIDIDNQEDGSCGVRYIVSELGEHQ